MSSILALAKQLQQLTAEELRDVLRETQSSTGAVVDLFDLAKLLLSRRELESRIRRLSATDLDSLSSGRVSDAIRESFLGAAEVFPEAQELLGNLEPGPLPKMEQGGGPLATFETLLSITELLVALEQHWFEVTKSGIRSPDAKPLAQKLHWASEQLMARFRLARAAGLVAEHDGRWAATAMGQRWLEADRETAWLQLAKAIWDLPPNEYRPGNLLDQLLAQHPLMPLSNLKFLQFGGMLGLLDRQDLLFSIGPKGPSAIVGELFQGLPKPEDRLIVQGDLSIVCPGPLSASLHRELDSFADSEELGLASRFRLSALSVSHHLELGGSLESIRKLLVAKSGRELPQPVEYLLADVERKFGTLQITGEHPTRILSKDQILLAQLANDRNLNHLNLVQVADRLESNSRMELCYFSLRAESYPAVMLDASGSVLSPRLGQHSAERVETEDGFLIRAEQLLRGEKAAGAASEITRQLQFALKNKLPVTVSVERPDGELERIDLVPLGLTETRLRGREKVREAERTLPISRIVSVLLD